MTSVEGPAGEEDLTGEQSYKPSKKGWTQHQDTQQETVSNRLDS